MNGVLMYLMTLLQQASSTAKSIEFGATEDYDIGAQHYLLIQAPAGTLVRHPCNAQSLDRSQLRGLTVIMTTTRSENPGLQPDRRVLYKVIESLLNCYLTLSFGLPEIMHPHLSVTRALFLTVLLLISIYLSAARGGLGQGALTKVAENKNVDGPTTLPDRSR